MHRLLKLLAMFGLIAAICDVSQAGVTTYTDPAAWSSNTTSILTTNFEGLAPDKGSISVPAATGLTRSGGSSFAVNTIESNGPMFVQGRGKSVWPQSSCLSVQQSTSTNDNIVVTLPSAFTSFSMILGTGRPPVQIRLPSGVVLSTPQISSPQSYFFGFTSSDPISKFEILSASGSGFDLLSFSFGSVSTSPSGTQIIYSSLGPNNTFSGDGFCVSGATAQGCTTVVSRYIAAPFTALVTSSISAISIAASNISGPNGVILNLRSNNTTGIPGPVLQSWSVQNLPGFGSTASISTFNLTSSMALQAGQKYWLEMQGLTSDSMEYWFTNSLGLGGGVTSISQAAWTPLSGYGGGTLPAFAIYGAGQTTDPAASVCTSLLANPNNTSYLSPGDDLGSHAFWTFGVSPNNCSWTITNDSPTVLAVDSPQSGQGDGAVTFHWLSSNNGKRVSPNKTCCQAKYFSVCIPDVAGFADTNSHRNGR
jgi:hypothetical protein